MQMKVTSDTLWRPVELNVHAQVMNTYSCAGLNTLKYDADSRFLQIQHVKILYSLEQKTRVMCAEYV